MRQASVVGSNRSRCAATVVTVGQPYDSDLEPGAVPGGAYRSGSAPNLPFQ